MALIDSLIFDRYMCRKQTLYDDSQVYVCTRWNTTDILDVSSFLLDLKSTKEKILQFTEPKTIQNRMIITCSFATTKFK